MKPLIIRTCLAVLNSRWINGTPCKYAFVGNVDAFSYDNLKSEVAQNPSVTVAEVVRQAEAFRTNFYREFADSQ